MWKTHTFCYAKNIACTHNYLACSQLAWCLHSACTGLARRSHAPAVRFFGRKNIRARVLRLRSFSGRVWTKARVVTEVRIITEHSWAPYTSGSNGLAVASRNAKRPISRSNMSPPESGRLMWCLILAPFTLPFPLSLSLPLSLPCPSPSPSPSPFPAGGRHGKGEWGAQREAGAPW